MVGWGVSDAESGEVEVQNNQNNCLGSSSAWGWAVHLVASASALPGACGGSPGLEEWPGFEAQGVTVASPQLSPHPDSQLPHSPPGFTCGHRGQFRGGAKSILEGRTLDDSHGQLSGPELQLSRG